MATQVLELTHPAKAKRPQAGTVHWLNQCIERGKTEVFDEQVILTPGLAQQILARNTNNRAVKVGRLAQLESDVKAGRWRFNGTAIQIRNDGVLGDGQHRCLAVVNVNISVPTKIGFGLDQAAIDTLDLGVARSPGDIAALHGVEDPVLSAAIARLIIGYRSTDGRSLGRSSTISNPAVQVLLASDPKISESAHFARGEARKVPVPGSIVGFCHYLLSEVNQRDAEEYLGQLASGAGLAKGDPALTVREFLIRRHGRSIKATGREKRVEAILRGWVAFREDRKLGSVNFGDSFPELD